MRDIFLFCWQYLRAFILLYLCLLAGGGISTLLPVEIPVSIIGMLIMFILLSLQIIPANWVKPGCNLLIRYMVLLFVPVGVGIMNDYDQLTSQFGPLIVSCVISTFVVILVVAYSSHYVHRKHTVIDIQENNKLKNNNDNEWNNKL